jgi:two-component system, sensor histidine kinase PdtaS
MERNQEAVLESRAQVRDSISVSSRIGLQSGLMTRLPVRMRHSRSIADPRAELAALHDIGEALSGAWNLNTTLHKITETTANAMQMDSCSIFLADKAGRELVLKASTGLASTSINVVKLNMGEGITGYAAELGKPVAVRDAASDPHFKYVPGTGERKFKSLLAVPLISQGNITGAMNVQTKSFHDFTQPEIELLSLIGELAAGALERAVLEDHLQRQVAELSTLARVSQTITAPIYLDEMLNVIAEMAAQIMQARGCALLLFDEQQSVLDLRAAYGLSREHAAISPIDMETSLTGLAIKSAQPLVVRDLLQEPLYRNKELARREGLRSFLSVPVIARDKVIGAFNCYMGSIHEFSKKEIELFSTLANQTALALENANLVMNSMLVREMHHRIKNNLQMVAMLLRLQIRQVDAASPREILHQTINRISSIAAVHEALSQEGFRLIGIKPLIQQAAHVATQNMLLPGQNIRVNIDGQDIQLPSQPATSVAIAANELIQNALEHGFRDRSNGLVQVNLITEEKDWVIQVVDDGIGMPADSEKSSLGLEIVRAVMNEDLHGQFHIAANSNGRGTCATLRIPRLSSG